MEFTCKSCSARFRPKIELPISRAVRVICPSCRTQLVLRPGHDGVPTIQLAPRRRQAVIADEPRPFRQFLGDELRKAGFEVTFFQSGEAALEKVQEIRADLVVLNVYLKGKLGVDISEEIKADPALANTKVILIGALFRANRFRANPTNLYGADDYVEELIPEREFQAMIRKHFPHHGEAEEGLLSRDFDDARTLSRLILSDIVIYNSDRVDEGIRTGRFFELLKSEIDDGRRYYESRVPASVRDTTDFFHETLEQFVVMKREEFERSAKGANPE